MMIPSRALAGAMVMIAAVFVSCAHTRAAAGPDGTRPVFLTNEVVYEFLDPSCAESQTDELQRIDGAYGDREFSFLVYALSGPEKIDLIILNDLGSEIARVSLSGGVVSASGLVKSAGLPAEYVLADFQLAFYRLECLRAALGPKGVRVEETQASASVRERAFLDSSGVISRIYYGAESLTLVNELRGYRYDIRWGNAL